MLSFAPTPGAEGEMREPFDMEEEEVAAVVVEPCDWSMSVLLPPHKDFSSTMT